MAFQLAQRSRIVVLMVSAWPEPSFREGVARLRGRGLAGAGADGNWRYRAGGPTRRGPGIGQPGDENSGLTEGRREKTE